MSGLEALYDVAGAADQLAVKDIGRDVGDAGEAAAGLPAEFAGGGVEGEHERLVPGLLPAELFVFAGAGTVSGHDEQAVV